MIGYVIKRSKERSRELYGYVYWEKIIEKKEK